MLYFFIARIYWEKEVLNREFELMSVATAVEMQIQANYQSLSTYQESDMLLEIEKNNLLNLNFGQVLKNTSKKNTNILLGYFDIKLDTAVMSSPNHNYDFIDNAWHKEISDQLLASGTPEFLSNAEVIDWDGKGVIGVTVPVYYQDEIVGHTWALMESGNIFYKSYMDYSRVFVPSIILWIFVILLIKRIIVNIKLSLDNFTDMILKDRLENQEDLEKLPELKPVFEKIRSHLDNLQS
jgi:hypothetical protein